MSYLKNKSDFNIDGAELLINNSLYAPSVHCSYYSVFQLMKARYISKKNISYQDYTNESSNNLGSSHTYLINNFCLLIGNHRDSLEFKRKVKDLKVFRTKSDYDNIEINIELSNKALRKAKELLSDIKKI